MNTQLLNKGNKSNKGSVLIISLILLLMLSIMAVSEMSLNSTQTHIASNTADAQIAFATAEAALNEATNNILSGSYNSSQFMANANGLYLFNPDAPALWTTVNWNSAGAVISSFQGKSNAQSAFIIEQLPSIIKNGQDINKPTQVYRITARAVGASGNGLIILQSTMHVQ